MRAAWMWMVAGLLIMPIMALADLAPPEEAEEPVPQEAEAPSEIPPGVKPGPTQVDLGHELSLDVPEEHVYLDKTVAAKVLEQNGSFHHDNDEGTSINDNTRVLGRRGYVSLNLVVDPENLEASKPHAMKLLQRATFKEGSRYADFQEGTDKVAEYGLAGIVLGGAGLGAAKIAKVGLLAKAGKLILGLLIAGKKLIAVVVVGLVVLLKKLFGSKNSENP